MNRHHRTRSSKSRKKKDKFIRCLLEVRKIPLIDFRLPRDGKKWQQRSRSRYHFLCKLAEDANPDGTFEQENGRINFSPGTKKLLQHMAKRSLSRMTNELRELGYLSWRREQNHYGRRMYRIDFPIQKHLPDSQQEQVPVSKITVATVAPVIAITVATVAPVITGQIDSQTTDTVGVNTVKKVPHPSLESLPSIADDAAAGSLGGRDAEKHPLESFANHHRHPLSAATAKADDDSARKYKTPSNGGGKAAPESESQRRKAEALANIKAEFKNEFSDEYIESAFAVIDGRAKKPIRFAKYYENAFRNDFSVTDRRSDRATEAQNETRVGQGPEIPESPACAHCDHTRTFHGMMEVNQKRHDPHWIKHEYSPVADDIPVSDAEPDDPDEPAYTEESISKMTDIVLFSYNLHHTDDYERAFNRAHREVVRFINRSGEFRSADKRDSFMEKLMRVGSVKQQRDAKYERKRLKRKELSESFGMFLNIYPNKANRAAAKKAWCKIPRAAQRVPEIIAGVERWKSSEQWDDPRHIPDAARFLNEQLWMDDPSGAQLIQ